jgi:hypothetical protein
VPRSPCGSWLTASQHHPEGKAAAIGKHQAPAAKGNGCTDTGKPQQLKKLKKKVVDHSIAADDVAK